jgi:hypothetical protein
VTCLAAYTPPGGNYPPYVNISEVPEGIRITVRERPEHPFHWGTTSQITVCREVAQQLFGEALEKLLETAE